MSHCITDVCGDAPKTVVSEVVDVTPAVVEDYSCDSTDQETILTTLSQLEIREEEGECHYIREEEEEG